MQEANKNGQASKSIGFLMNVSDFDAEIAAISEIDAASKVVLQVGNMEDFDTYYQDLREKHKKAGMDKVLEAVNKQYSDWKSNRGK